jgi:hypothetical protein
MLPIPRHHSFSAIDQPVVPSQDVQPASQAEPRDSTSKTIFLHGTPSSSNITVLRFMTEANLVSVLTRRSSLANDSNATSSAQRQASTLPILRHGTRSSFAGRRTYSDSEFNLNTHTHMPDLPGQMTGSESMRKPEPGQTFASPVQRDRTSSFGMDPWAIPVHVQPPEMPSTPAPMACIQPAPVATSQKVSRGMLKDGIRNGLPFHDIQHLLANVTRGPYRWQSVSADRQWRTRRLMDAVRCFNPTEAATLAPFVRSLGITEKELRSCIKNMMRGHFADTGFSQRAISSMLEVLHTNHPMARNKPDYVAWGVRRQAEIDARFSARDANLLSISLENPD